MRWRPLMNDGENARWDMAIALADELTPHARTEGRKNAYVFFTQWFCN